MIKCPSLFSKNMENNIVVIDQHPDGHLDSFDSKRSISLFGKGDFHGIENGPNLRLRICRAEHIIIGKRGQPLDMQQGNILCMFCQRGFSNAPCLLFGIPVCRALPPDLFRNGPPFYYRASSSLYKTEPVAARGF